MSVPRVDTRRRVVKAAFASATNSVAENTRLNTGMWSLAETALKEYA